MQKAPRHRFPRRRAIVVVTAAVLLCIGAGPALAAWLTSGLGSTTVRASDLSTPAAPTLSTNGSGRVVVSWQATSLSTGQAATGYVVRRIDTSGTTQVCTVSAPTLTCTDPTAVATSASYTVAAKFAGWTSAQSPAKLYDVAAPTTTLSTSSNANANGLWNTSPVGFTLTATDGGSGVKSITYQVGTATAKTVDAATATFNVSIQGTTVIKYQATDNAGNVESQKSFTLKLDSVAPTAPTGLVIDQDTGSGATDEITSDNSPSVKGNAEAGSSVEVRIDGSLRWTVTAASNGTFATPPTYSPGTELNEGTHTVSVRAVDAAGNAGATATLPIRIDRTGPTAALTGYCDSTHFCGTASDGSGSGIWRVTYEIKRKGAWSSRDACWNGTTFSTTACGYDKLFATGTTSWSAPIPSSTTSGTYELRVRAEDIAGNSSAEIFYSVTM